MKFFKDVFPSTIVGDVYQSRLSPVLYLEVVEHPVSGIGLKSYMESRFSWPCRMWAFDPSIYIYLGNSEELHLKCALLMEVDQLRHYNRTIPSGPEYQEAYKECCRLRAAFRGKSATKW